MDIKIITCECCGEEVYCARFTNECFNCGTLYNSFGQMLKPYEEWMDEWLDGFDEY